MKDKRQKLEQRDAKEGVKTELKKTDFSADITPEDVQLMQAMGIPFVHLSSVVCGCRILLSVGISIYTGKAC